MIPVFSFGPTVWLVPDIYHIVPGTSIALFARLHYELRMYTAVRVPVVVVVLTRAAVRLYFSVSL